MTVRSFVKGGMVIRLHVGADLRGSLISSLTPSERWVWIALRMLTAESPYRPVLCISPGVPFTDRQIADQLMVPISLWKKTKIRLENENVIQIDPKLGINVPWWLEWGPVSYQKKFKPAMGMVHFTEEDLIKDRDARRDLCAIFSTLTGVPTMMDNAVFVTRYRDRLEEGATREDIEIAMRTYCNLATQASLMVVKRLNPASALAPESFWKFLKKNRPIYSRVINTNEYIMGLPDGTRQMARNFAKEYTMEMKLTMRKNGWSNLSEIDFDKVPTCKQYVMSKMEGR